MLIQSAAPQFILVNINHVRFGFYTYNQQIFRVYSVCLKNSTRALVRLRNRQTKFRAMIDCRAHDEFQETLPLS